MMILVLWRSGYKMLSDKRLDKNWNCGYHVLEKMLFPNGSYGMALVWHEGD